jgi:hypothetical protein
MKQMRELKNDIDWALVRNHTSTAGGANTGLSLASIESWIGATSPSSATATNVILATSTISTGNFPETASGTPIAQTDCGSTAALVEADLRLALQAVWDDGGDCDVILCNAGVKNVINDFTSLATRNVDLGRTQQAVITGASDLYVSSFGVHKVVLNRHARTNVCLCLDSSMWSIATLRPPQMETLAKTGDGEKRHMLCELTLVSRNWRANSKIVGIA